MNSLLWTEPPEMTTAVTNLLIAGICAVFAVRMSGMKRDEPLEKTLWVIFYLVMIPTAVFGFFIHALVLAPETKRTAWLVLAVTLGLATTSLSITLFTEIFGKAHFRKILLLNLAGEILFAAIVGFLISVVPRIHVVFVAYTGVVLFIILVLLFRHAASRPHFRWYITAIFTVVVGGLFALTKGHVINVIWAYDQNSACHLALAAALCFFAAGCLRCRTAVKHT